MLKLEGNVIVNDCRNPVALLEEDCVLVCRTYWRDSRLRGKVAEIAGARKQLKMPEEIYMDLSEKKIDEIVGKGWL